MWTFFTLNERYIKINYEFYDDGFVSFLTFIRKRYVYEILNLFFFVQLFLLCQYPQKKKKKEDIR